MKTQVKVKRHRIASILFPVIGGAAIVSGVVAGVVVLNNNAPRVSPEQKDLVINEVTKNAVLNVNIDDDVKDDRVFAYIENKQSSTVTNKTNVSSNVDTSVVVFESTKRDSGEFALSRNKLSAKITVDNIPTTKGTYVYEFDVTLIYSNNEDKEIKREVKGLTLTYEVEKDLISISDPKLTNIQTEYEDESGNATLLLEDFCYTGLTTDDFNNLSISTEQTSQPDCLRIDNNGITITNVTGSTFDVEIPIVPIGASPLTPFIMQNHQMSFKLNFKMGQELIKSSSINATIKAQAPSLINIFSDSQFVGPGGVIEFNYSIWGDTLASSLLHWEVIGQGKITDENNNEITTTTNLYGTLYYHAPTNITDFSTSIWASSDTGAAGVLSIELIPGVDFTPVLINGSFEPFSLNVGATATATTTASAGGYKWSVTEGSDPAIIINENTGVITAAEPGTAKVTATSTIDPNFSITSELITVTEDASLTGFMTNQYESSSFGGVMKGHRSIDLTSGTDYKSLITFDFNCVNWKDFSSNIPDIYLDMDSGDMSSHTCIIKFLDPTSNLWLPLEFDKDWFYDDIFDYTYIHFSTEVNAALALGIISYIQVIYTYRPINSIQNFAFYAEIYDVA